jgi:conjugative transfer signal peptidase TraF
MAAAATVCASISLAGFFGGLRLNTTPSEPLGLWQIVPLDRPVAIGDLVFACMPENAYGALGKTRGYLRWGMCPGGAGPLIKRIVATAGQRVDMDGRVSIDGARLPNSKVIDADGKGRLLHAYLGGVVPDGYVFLHSPFPGSWDSRYFGPIPSSGILGLAREVLTYEP